MERVPVVCLECGQTTKVGAVAKCGICSSDQVRMLDRDERLRIVEDRLEKLSKAVAMNADSARLALEAARAAGVAR